MLDKRFVYEHAEDVKQGLTAKGFDASLVDQFLELYPHVQKLDQDIQALQTERNRVASLGAEARDEGKRIKEQLQPLEEEHANAAHALTSILERLPNLPSMDTPVGEGETANTVIRRVGEINQSSDLMDHVALNERFDLFDSERGAKVASTRFNFLKNEAVLLEFALVRFALDLAIAYGYTPMVTPELVNEKTVKGTGYFHHGQDEIYKTQDDLYLIGTSELALVGYHQDEVLTELPKRYVGFSTCFRREAGSYGKDTRGILRQHQFDKVELVSLVKPEDSDAELERILALEEDIMQRLGLPYQVVQIGTGDLGFQASKKFDIETWMPGQQTYRETHSCSNTTDFQSRRLNIRYKTEAGKNEFVHALNGTAIAIGRMLIAILENGQGDDGRIHIPEALVPYAGFATIG